MRTEKLFHQWCISHRLTTDGKNITINACALISIINILKRLMHINVIFWWNFKKGTILISHICFYLVQINETNGLQTYFMLLIILSESLIYWLQHLLKFYQMTVYEYEL